MEHVVLVDENDRETGTLEKMEAHRRGVLHRAFSVILFNSEGKVLLQQRAADKYHSQNLWTNTCCSHPRPGESIVAAAQRRLKEEMGIECTLTPQYAFLYKTSLENNLIEHELDHVLTGTFDGTPEVNAREVQNWKFVDLKDVQKHAETHPELYTYWFRLILGHPQFKSLAS